MPKWRESLVSSGMETLSPFSPARDASTASWVVKGLTGFLDKVTSVVPAGYEAYARIHHPAWLGEEGLRAPKTWREVAEENNRIAHKGMQWHGIAGGYLSLDDDGFPASGAHLGSASKQLELPAMGSLPAEVADPLLQILYRHTESEAGWFAIWEGFGALDVDLESAASFGVPERRYHLFSGPLAAIAQSFGLPPIHQSANLWWPDDRAWCVATEIDFMTTYVGGTAKAIDAITRSPHLESTRVEASDDVSVDLLNAAARQKMG